MNLPDPVARPTRVRYGVTAWLCGVAVIAYIHRSAIAIPAAQIRDDLSLTETQMGIILGGFFGVYAVSQIPAGWLGDRWGSRRSLPLYVTVSSLATGSIGAVVGLTSIFASQAACGLAQAGIFPSASNTLSKWFSSSRRGLPLGLIGSFQSLGVIAANVLVAWLLLQMSWRTIFPLVSILGFVWAGGFLVWFRDRPDDHSAVNESELRIINEGSDGSHGVNRGTAAVLRAIVRSPTLGLLCGQQFFRAAGFVFYQTWFPTYLRETRGVALEDLGYLSSLPSLAFVIALPASGALADYIQSRTSNLRLSRQLPSVFFMTSAALSFVAAHFTDAAVPAVMLITMGAVCVSLGSTPGNVLTIDLSGQQVATVCATVNMAGNIGATLSPLMVGVLVDWTDNWHHVLLLFVAFYLATALCWVFLNPNRPIFENESDLPR